MAAVGTDAPNGLCVSSFLGWSSLRAQHATTRSRRAGGDGLFGDLIPHLKSGGHVGGVLGGVYPVAGGRKCGKSDWKRTETVALNRQCGTLHRAFALPGRLTGFFAPIIQVFVLPVLRCRHRLPVCNLVTAKFVGDQHP